MEPRGELLAFLLQLRLDAAPAHEHVAVQNPFGCVHRHDGAALDEDRLLHQFQAKRVFKAESLAARLSTKSRKP